MPARPYHRQTMDVKYDVSSYRRVLELASTPSWDEFSQVALIAGAGIVLIGILGFLIFAVMTVLPGA
jgi:protein transport protein SEC61 subunit gamma-like protein